MNKIDTSIIKELKLPAMEQLGYITELIQTTLFGINVGMSRWMMKIGRVLGDVNVIKEK